MQILIPGQTYYGEFTTRSLSTGAAADADSTPVATANKNGTDDAAFILTVAKVGTGRYSVSGTVPSGYAAGDRVHVSVAATIGGVAYVEVIDGFQVGYLPVNTVQVGGATASVLPASTIPTAEENAAAVAEAAPDFGVFPAESLVNAPTGSGGSGSGARSVTLTVNDGTNTLEGATVRLSLAAETYVVTTNVNGQAALSLDDGTWTVTITKPLYSFTPTTLVVSATTTHTYSMTAMSITPSEVGSADVLRRVS